MGGHEPRRHPADPAWDCAGQRSVARCGGDRHRGAAERVHREAGATPLRPVGRHDQWRAGHRFGSPRQVRDGSPVRARQSRPRHVGRNLGIRLTPSLEFIADAIPETAAHLEVLLAEARERDAQVAAAASGASYAGDADPYKRDEDDDTDDAAETDGSAEPRS